MEKDYFRYYKPRMLLLLIVILSVFYGYLLDLFTTYVNSFLNSPYFYFPTASSLIILTFLKIDKKGLKWSLTKCFFWVKDISGRYSGSIKYKNYHTKIEETKNCFLEIEQSASKICVNTYFDFKNNKNTEKTTSKSLVCSIVSKDDFDNQTLVFTYHNSGNILKGLQPSNGTNILELIKRKSGFFLEGIYYTDKNPQTKGTMKVKFISNKLQKKF